LRQDEWLACMPRYSTAKTIRDIGHIEAAEGFGRVVQEHRSVGTGADVLQPLLQALLRECSNRTLAPSTSGYLDRERHLQSASEDRRSAAKPPSAPDRCAHTGHPSGNQRQGGPFLHVRPGSARIR